MTTNLLGLLGGWKGYAAAVLAGCFLIGAAGLAVKSYGDRRAAAAVQAERQAAAVERAKLVEEYRRREEETQKRWDDDYAKISAGRDLAQAAASAAASAAERLHNTVATERARAAQAARAAGRSERAATAAWDVLQECRAAYVDLGREAERVLGVAIPLQAWAKVVSSAQER